jgi:CBS domain-containing protein
MKVSEILQVKGSILYTITPDQPLAEAANTMAEKDIGSLVVMEFGDLVGMLTFREVLRALHANDGSVRRRHGAQAHGRPPDHGDAGYRSE